MEKNMELNFKYLKERVADTLNKTDLEYIRNELKKINDSTISCGVGGSSVVSEFAKKVLNKKNDIVTVNFEPRDFNYFNTKSFKNVLSCSYSGNNFGVQTSFNNDLKHYLLSNNRYDDPNTIYLTYDTDIEKERSFISLGATLMPISILLNYYLNGNNDYVFDMIKERSFNFDVSDIYEIFSGCDSSVTSKYLESTLVESGIGVPIVHDKYSFCHGRSTFQKNYDSTPIYLNRGSELDKLLLENIRNNYKQVIVIESISDDFILDDYQMLIQAMYLTKFIAESKKKDLSNVNYSDIVKNVYRFRGEM